MIFNALLKRSPLTSRRLQNLIHFIAVGFFGDFNICSPEACKMSE